MTTARIDLEHFKKLQQQLEDLKAEVGRLTARLAYFEELPDFNESGRSQHRFNAAGICIRCGCDAEEWEEGCVEELEEQFDIAREQVQHLAAERRNLWLELRDALEE